MSWVRKTRKQQEDARGERTERSASLNSLSTHFFTELYEDARRDVEEINEAYSDTFNRHTNSHLVLREQNATSFKVTCGPSDVLEVERTLNPPGLKVTRRIITNTPGKFRFVPQPYFYKLDGQGGLYVETGDGRAVACADMSEEIFGFIPKSLDR